jgi:hypothetical protein
VSSTDIFSEKKMKKDSSQPPMMVSGAYFEFMHQRTELSEFVNFYHMHAKLAVQPEGGEPNVEIYEEYRGLSIFFLENYISRISDFFDQYIENLTVCVCDEKGDFLTEKEYSKAKERLEKRGLTEVLQEEVTLEAVVKFCRRHKSEIAQSYLERIGFDMASISKHWDEVLICSEIRNLIVHKGSIMDERFVTFASNHKLPFDIGVGTTLLLPERWLLALASKIDKLISVIDDEITKYVPIQKRNRMGHIWLPRSVLLKSLKEVEAG